MKNKKFSFKDKRDFAAIKMIQAGDKEAYAYIFNKYYSLVYYKMLGYLNGNVEEAEDVVMVAFAKVYSNISKYKVNMTFNAWLSTVVKNELIDHVRKMGRHKKNVGMESFSIDEIAFSTKENSFVSKSERISSGSMNAEQEMIANERSTMVRKAIKQLDNENHRIALELVYMKGLSYEEVAERTNMKINSLKVYVYRAKAELKKILERMM